MEPGAAVAVVDYGMGNLRSVWQALEHVAEGRKVLVTSSPEELLAAERVVFPGQGCMPDCLHELNARGLREAVIEATQSKPFLGICIGQQMLFESSEEGDVPGLGILPGRVRRFPADKMFSPQGERLKVPHMGWNEVRHTQPHALWRGIDEAARFYFVHSYYVTPGSPEMAVGTTDYGQPFTSAVARDNIFALQCHPEKSAQTGLTLLANFMQWRP